MQITDIVLIANWSDNIYIVEKLTMIRGIGACVQRRPIPLSIFDRRESWTQPLVIIFIERLAPTPLLN